MLGSITVFKFGQVHAEHWIIVDIYTAVLNIPITVPTFPKQFDRVLYVNLPISQ